jgi:exportin-1
VVKFVEGMFDVNMDLLSFKTHLRDFLIELKEFNTGDNSALYSEEQEREREQREMDVMAERSSVPGMIKPSDVIDNDL